VSAVESHVLSSLPGRQTVFRTWQELRAGLAEMVRGARRVAMEYSPENANPYVAKVDAGTVELVHSFGPGIGSSGDFPQQFEAVLTPAQLDSHRAAGRALLRARDSLFAWLRTQLQADDTALSERDVQAEFARLMRAEGLEVPEHDKPLCAVNG